MEMGVSDADAMEVQRRVMAEAMEDGAIGVSYALIYPPEAFVGTDEIVEVCKVLAKYGGVYITHLRSEADTFIQALDEAIEIGQRSGAAVEVYHLKVSGTRNFTKMTEAIDTLRPCPRRWTRHHGRHVPIHRQRHRADLGPAAVGGRGRQALRQPARPRHAPAKSRPPCSTRTAPGRQCAIWSGRRT